MRNMYRFKIFMIIISLILSTAAFIPIINGKENITIVSINNVDIPVDDNGHGFLTVNNVSNLGSCEATLSWDPDVVNVIDVGDSEFDSIYRYVNNTSGFLNVVAFSNDPMNGNFTIARVTFERATGANAGDECDLEIIDSILFTADPISNEIIHNTTNGIAKINDVGDIVKIIMGSVDVPVTGYGYGFLMVSNVSNLGSCDATISWDPDVVNVIDVGYSDFDFLEYYIDYSAGILNIIVFSNDSMNGDFTIAMLTFESAPGANAGDECDLEIINSMLYTAEPFPINISHIRIYGKAIVFGNSPPNKPTLVSPLDGSTISSSTSAVLIIQAFDPDIDKMKITFYNSFDDSVIYTVNNVPTGSSVSATWLNLISGNSYSWYAVANDSEFETKSDIWSFTTQEIDVELEIYIMGGVGINSHFINIGGDDLNNIEWSTSVKSKGLLGLIDETYHGTIIKIVSGGEIIVKKILTFGFYSLEISTTAEYEGEIVATEKVDSLLIGPWIIII